MKIKIVKELDGSFSITSENVTYILKISSVGDEIVIEIEEKNKEEKTEKNYSSTFTLPQLCKINAVFNIFTSIDDALKGITAQLESEFFGLNKAEKVLHLSFIIFGKNISIPISQEKSENKVVYVTITSIKEEYERLLLPMSNSLSQIREMIQPLSKINTVDEKEKTEITQKVSNILEEHQKNFNLLKEKVKNAFKLSLVKTIPDHVLSVESLCVLKDGRLASASKDKTIRIFNTENYNCELTLRGHKEGINYVSLFEDSKLISSSDDKTIKIWNISKDNYIEIQTLEGHTQPVLKSIELSNNRIASCGEDETVRIWDSNFNCIKILEERKSLLRSIIETKDKKYIVSGGLNRNLIFWNNSTYECEERIEDVHCEDRNCLFECNGKLLVGGNEIYIVDLNTLKLEKLLILQGTNHIASMIQIDSDNILFSCYSRGLWGFTCFNLKDKKVVDMQEGIHDPNIHDLVRIKDNIYATCGKDATIKIWKY